MGEQIKALALIDSLTLGGAEALLVDLAQAAPGAGIALDVGYLREVDGSPIAKRLREVGIEPLHVGAEPGLHPRSFRKVGRLIEQLEPDVVHTHLDTADMLGAVAAMFHRVPSIATVHLIPRPVRAQVGHSRIRDIVRRRAATTVRNRCTCRVLCVSEAARVAYLEVAHDRPSHVTTVHNGVQRSVTPEEGREVREQLGIDREEIVVSMISVLRHGKGHACATAAFRGLLERWPQLRLMVVGDGPLRAEVEALLRPLGNRAIFTGYRTDVMALLAATDVLIHPTEADAFPTVLLEAAAAGVPVIASSVGGIGEIVENGKTGLLLDDPYDASKLARLLDSLIGQADLRSALGAAAHGRYRSEFSAEVWAGKLAQIYGEVLAGRRGRAPSK